MADLVVMFGNVPFDHLWQRCQQLATHLAGDFEFIYVDPNRSFLHRWKRSKIQFANAPTTTKILRFVPPTGLPWARQSGFINHFNYQWIKPALGRWIRQRTGKKAPDVVMLCYPDQLPVSRWFPEATLVYDVMDEPGLFAPARQQAKIEAQHHELLAHADLAIFSSHVLFETYAAKTKTPVCITNGVSGHFISAMKSAEPASEFANLPGPRLGYVGMISHWFDFSAVEKIALAFPTGTILLVGPADIPLPKLPSNVVITGPRAHAELPAILRSFDVGLIPFIRSAGIDAVNPVKLFEYLSAGLPVVAARWREIENYGDAVCLYDHAGAAAKQVANALGELPWSPAKRKQFADQQTWRHKADEFIQALGLVPNNHRRAMRRVG